MTIRACIFELDDIIIETSKYYSHTLEQLAGRNDIRLDPKQVEKLKLAYNLENIKSVPVKVDSKMTNKKGTKTVDINSLVYKNHLERITPDQILPGVYEFFLEAKTNHVMLALVSETSNAKSILQRLELNNLFNTIVEEDFSAKTNNNPGVLLRTLDEMKVKPSESLAFESTIYGIQAAHDAGLLCIGVGLDRNLITADYLINGFSETGWSDIINMISN